MKRRMRAGWGAVLVVASVAGGVFVTSSPAGATPTSVTLYVQKYATSGTCTSATPCGYVGEAVHFAQNTYHGDAVTVTVGPGTYTNTYEIEIGSADASLVIQGAGAATTTVSATGTDVFDIFRSSSVTITGLSIVNGDTHTGGGVLVGTSTTVTFSDDAFSTDTAESGGGVYVAKSTTVTFSDDAFSTDTAESGGGVYVATSTTVTFADDKFSNDEAESGAGIAISTAAVTVTASTFTRGTAETGGAIDNSDGTLVATHDTFSRDTGDLGGAIANTGTGPHATVSHDTFSHDRAEYGGAIFNAETGTHGATLEATDDTFLDDSAGTWGGAVLSGTTGSTAALVDDTFLDDSGSGGGVAGVFDGQATVDASIFDASTCGTLDGGSLSGTYDVTTTGSCNFGSTDETVTTAALHLATTLETNGSTGPETLAIGTTSAAFEAVPPAACTVSTDERTKPRPGIPGQTYCDAGAFEYQTGETVTLGTTETGATTTLYVRAGATGSSCTAPTEAAACGTLESAVTLASEDSGAMTVTVGPGTYDEHGIKVTAGALTSLTIKGAGAASTVVDGRTAGSVLLVHSGSVTIEDLSITHGTATDGYGGGIDTYDNGTITVVGDTFATDHARDDSGAVNVTSSGHASFSDDTFVGDSSPNGGAINSTDGTVTVNNSTFVDDSAEYGGAIREYGHSATLTDDTFETDSATGRGGIFADAGSVTVTDSVLAGTACTRATGPLSGSYDVTTTASCNFGSTDETVTTTSLDLAPTLAPNTSTGPETLAIGPGSAAFEFVPPVACTVHTDERGEPRPGVPGANCDAGAYEYQGQAVTTTACPVGSSGCSTSTSRPGRTVVVGSNGVKVTGTGGRGTVGEGTYRHDPAGPLPSSTGKFFAVSLSSGSTLKMVVVTVCGVGTGTALEWWNGSAWEHVEASTGASTGPGGDCISVTLGPSTTPSLATIARLSRMSRFGAVVFGVVH